MAQAGAPKSEILLALKCSTKTLDNACRRDHECSLDEFLEAHRAEGRLRIRMERFKLATERKSWKALEWLSRQLLGETMTDKLNVTQRASAVHFFLPSNGREVLPDGRTVTMDGDTIDIKPRQTAKIEQ